MAENKNLFLNFLLIINLFWLLYCLLNDHLTLELQALYGFGIACAFLLSGYNIGEFFIMRHLYKK